MMADSPMDMLEELLALSDADLSEKLGYDDKLEQFKADLAAAKKLTGKARDRVNQSLNDMFTPRDYAAQDFHWAVQDAGNKAAGKTTPQSIVDCCCGDAAMDD